MTLPPPPPRPYPKGSIPPPPPPPVPLEIETFEPDPEAVSEFLRTEAQEAFEHYRPARDRKARKTS